MWFRVPDISMMVVGYLQSKVIGGSRKEVVVYSQAWVPLLEEDRFDGTEEMYDHRFVATESRRTMPWFDSSSGGLGKEIVQELPVIDDVHLPLSQTVTTACVVPKTTALNNEPIRQWHAVALHAEWNDLFTHEKNQRLRNAGIDPVV